jgi:hypothetical protein
MPFIFFTTGNPLFTLHSVFSEISRFIYSKIRSFLFAVRHPI